MLNGREPTGLVRDALDRLSIYQQLDSERNGLIQVSITGAILIRH